MDKSTHDTQQIDTSQPSSHNERGMTHQSAKHKNSYRNLLWMMILSFLSMYILMYAMVDRLENVIPNVNQFYMAGLMTAPMLIFELLLMKSMYPNKKLNTFLLATGAVLLIGFWLAIRTQAVVGDTQFLKSMIPHHAGAILMVEEAELSDPDVKKLGEEIIQTQLEEIRVMKEKIKELEQNTK